MFWPRSVPCVCPGGARGAACRSDRAAHPLGASAGEATGPVTGRATGRRSNTRCCPREARGVVAGFRSFIPERPRGARNGIRCPWPKPYATLRQHPGVRPGRRQTLDLYAEFLALIDVLTERELDYALCGGIAVAFHGYPRFTKDIDLLIRAEDLGQVRAAARDIGFALEAGPIPFDSGGPRAREIFRVSKVEQGELLTIDTAAAEPAVAAGVGRPRRLRVAGAAGADRLGRGARADEASGWTRSGPARPEAARVGLRRHGRGR